MELIYLRSPTGQQHERALEVLDVIRRARPDLTIREVDPLADPDFAKRYAIKYSPGLILNGRIEFVGIPRETMLLERIELVSRAPVAPPPEQPKSAPAAVMSPEERQRRIEEAKKLVAVRLAGSAPTSTPAAPPVSAGGRPGTGAPAMTDEERQGRIEEAKRLAATRGADGAAPGTGPGTRTQGPPEAGAKNPEEKEGRIDEASQRAEQVNRPKKTT